MVGDRLRANSEMSGDRRVAVPTRQLVKDLPLTARQIVQSSGFPAVTAAEPCQHPRRDRGAEDLFPGGDGVNRALELLLASIFQDLPVRASPQRQEDWVIVLEERDHQDRNKNTTPWYQGVVSRMPHEISPDPGLRRSRLWHGRDRTGRFSRRWSTRGFFRGNFTKAEVVDRGRGDGDTEGDRIDDAGDQRRPAE